MKVLLEEILESLTIVASLNEIATNKSIKEYKDSIRITRTKGDYLRHSKGLGFIALYLANKINLSDITKKEVYITAIIHDIGVAKVQFNKAQSEVLKDHCEEGANIIERIPYISHLANYVKYHHENIDGTGVYGLKDKEIPLISQILRISGLIEVASTIEDIDKRDFVYVNIVENCNKYVCKDLEHKVIELFEDKEFLEILNDTNLRCKWIDKNKPVISQELDIYEFQQVADIYAEMIDYRRPFTARHSRGIAELAYATSKYNGYNEEKCVKMKIAGLLHDIGKMAVPLKYITKNGKLTEEEFNILKKHAFYTHVVLEPIKSIGEIKEWAASHHEKLDGTGYFRGVYGNSLGPEQRLLAVCDIYQALTEDRPYRLGMDKEEAFKIIDALVHKKQICSEAFDSLKNAVNSGFQSAI